LEFRFQNLESRNKITVGTQYTSFCTRKMVAAIPTSTQCLSYHTYIYSMPVHIYSMPVPPHLHLFNACPHLLNACPATPTSTQCLLPPSQKKKAGTFSDLRGFRTRGNVFRIGGNTFYNRKNKILMKIAEFEKVQNWINCRIPWNSERISQPS
jgi:hypothetical protein